MKSIVYSLAAAAIALTACTKEYENTYILPQEGEKTLDQMGVTLPEQTRTYLEGNDVLWEIGDKITAWSDYATTPITFSLNGEDAISNGGKTALFTVGFNQGVKYPENETTNFYAIYPASTAQTISVPQNQTWKGFKNFYQNVNPMIAKGTDFSNMTFQNPCAILAFKLAAKEGNAATLTRIEVSSQSARLSGTATVNWANMSLQWTAANYNVTLQGNSEAIPTDTNNPGIYYIVIPAGSYNDFTINVVYRSDKGRTFTKTRDVNNAMQIEAGKIFTFNTVFQLETEDPKAPETYAVGDIYPKTGTPQGVVFEVAADGLSGKIAALKDCDVDGEPGEEGVYTYLWGTFNASTSTTDGLSNTNRITSSPAVNACKAMRTSGSPEWYLPARDELVALCDAQGDISGNANYEDMFGMMYWSSTLTGLNANVLRINYYDAEEGGIVTTRLSTSGSMRASVRAIAQFESK